jgi:hypothetical protein
MLIHLKNPSLNQKMDKLEIKIWVLDQMASDPIEMGCWKVKDKEIAKLIKKRINSSKLNRQSNVKVT